jgi:hypothetical protein
MVILGGVDGWVEICVDENGSERVVAVRGLGQLVGERAALKVSVRSATVIPLEMVWALVVQTKDFAALITCLPGSPLLSRAESLQPRPRTAHTALYSAGGRERYTRRFRLDPWPGPSNGLHLSPCPGEPTSFRPWCS